MAHGGVISMSSSKPNGALRAFIRLLSLVSFARAVQRDPSGLLRREVRRRAHRAVRKAL
jgi:hypothetical protein